ncbi:MAG: hypothetical protein KQH63_10270 [Desulfobulbaceae bacterium]|nr:hypothetical protein [Desulfobulbaceae bacterium]
MRMATFLLLASKKNRQKSPNNYIHTDRLTLPVFGGSSTLFTTAKSFLGWLAAGDVWR